jgi:hypothetical protein
MSEARLGLAERAGTTIGAGSGLELRRVPLSRTRAAAAPTLAATASSSSTEARPVPHEADTRLAARTRLSVSPGLSDAQADVIWHVAAATGCGARGSNTPQMTAPPREISLVSTRRADGVNP